MWIDGGLSRRWDARVRRHLARCAACAAEAESLRATITWQRRVLPQVVMLEDFSAAPLRVQLRRALAVQSEEAAPWWAWLSHPLAIAGAAAVMLLLVFALAGGPRAVLIPLGVQAPPVAVTREPELFKDYPLIQDLDVLENFDTVESVPLDDEQAAQRG